MGASYDCYCPSPDGSRKEFCHLSIHVYRASCARCNQKNPGRNAESVITIRKIAASGLKTNMAKCLISPIQCNLDATVQLLTHFPGKIDPFPIRYLGIPLGLRQLSKADLQPLVDKVANRLPTWKAGLLNRAGRTILIKSTLSAIPTHTALAINLSPWVIKRIDNCRRGFLWKGAQSARGGHCLLAWPRVCRPPELGGLGIVDLQRFRYALRMRWLWPR